MEQFILQYKEDRYSDMVREAGFNPFNITTEPSLNSNLRFGNLTEVFAKELGDLLPSALSGGMKGDQIICGYIFNMIESYYNNAGYVPKAAMDAIIEQVYEAVIDIGYGNWVLNNIDKLKYKMYWDLTHN